ncbi:helix-turn-helix domain-containing protein [Sphingosinicella sp. CPCC 101087]|uniref:AraC family transcriptional regulator n=1 Tax=Sphingosinicella sp. CPCC 101087 TaxID=2497754 RepID=UPI00101C0CE8|nr:helix-turn-helix domain-containing protein [Sphingosinicella sp. CPCC 101087]
METHPRLSVRAHDDGVDRWEIVEALPALALRKHVARYSIYWEQTGSFAARRELASTSGVLIYALGEPLEITGANGTRVTVAAGEAFAGAIADGSSVSRALGPQEGIHVFLPLASLTAITGAPLSEIANQVAPLRDLIGPAADDLGGRLCEAADAEARFGHLDHFLARRLADDHDHDRAVAWAMHHLAAAEGPVTSRLADEIGWSRRHFVRRFRAATGFSPDRFRRLTRFERFAEAIMRSPEDSLAGLAANCGYVDQAHLTRDVRAFSDMTPGELRARLLPSGGGVRDG